MPPGEGGRRPGAVPDDGPDVDRDPHLDPYRDPAVDVRSGVDTDGDGWADTLLAVDGPDLLVQTDLDGDGLADRVLRIGPDAAVRPVDPPRGDVPTSWGWLLDDLFAPDGDAGG